jgi:hypothetical protein
VTPCGVPARRRTDSQRASLPVVAGGFLLAATIAGAAVACTPAAGPGDRDGPVERPTAAATPGADTSVPAYRGPFDGLTWSGRPVPVDALLHDDGSRLWSVELSGRRTLVWKHPPASVPQLAASPDGERVAMSVGLEPRNGSQPSFLLYVLERDGSVRLADTTRAFRSIDSPVFLRPPSSRGASPDRLYWIRTGESVDPFGRLDSELMVLTDHGAREVRVPLRFTEAVFGIHGFPGAPTATLTLFRQNDVPTRAEVLRNDDHRSGVTPASLTLWGNNEFRANTDVLNGVAWVSPTEYVIPVAHRFHRGRYELRLFRIGCESLGSHVAYEGREIDWGYSELPWRIMPAGAGRVLVLGADDARHANAAAPGGPTWLAVDLDSGRISATEVGWSPGGWTWLARPARGDGGRDVCDDLDWSWP